MIHGVSVDFFLSVVDFFPVIHSWSFVHQSSMFRVVDVLCAVSYTVAENEWIFFFSVMTSTPCSSFFIDIIDINQEQEWAQD